MFDILLWPSKGSDKSSKQQVPHSIDITKSSFYPFTLQQNPSIMPRRFRDQGKRQWVDEDDEDTVDDLAHAATFAMMTMIPDPTNFSNTHYDGTVSISHSDQAMTSMATTEKKDEDQDDIELEESSSDDDDDAEENRENNQPVSYTHLTKMTSLKSI